MRLLNDGNTIRIKSTNSVLLPKTDAIIHDPVDHSVAVLRFVDELILEIQLKKKMLFEQKKLHN